MTTPDKQGTNNSNNDNSPVSQEIIMVSLHRSLILKLFLSAILLSFSYFLGLHGFSHFSNSYPKSYTSSESESFDCVANSTNRIISIRTNATAEAIEHLDFDSHHSIPLLQFNAEPFPSCPFNFSVYCPCHDLDRGKQYTTKKLLHKERHCPDNSSEKLRCLIPIPSRYRKPFPWPKSRDYAWFNNVPFKRLTVLKKSQNWVRLEGDLLAFPGGGTSFTDGVRSYVNEIGRAISLKGGKIRTALDVGCGVASFGARLFNYDILTMSIAPRDIHEAQVQFALERGVPSMLEVLGTYRLPYPSRSFDLAHCSRCLVDWTANEGLNLIEIDRILRPGAYWVLSGPPINWKNNYRGWNRTKQSLEEEQNRLQDLATRLCWKKISEKLNIAIWQKPQNHVHCIKKLKVWKSLRLCEPNNPDSGWYTEMKACITPLPNVANATDVAGGAVKKWPNRLNGSPSRGGVSKEKFKEDTQMWVRRVKYYESLIGPFSEKKFRNVMDMNAGYGGFAAAVAKYPLWVMNVVPPEGTGNLSVVYDRGLVGTYMDWCEPFSTFPRTYDMVHADGVVGMYKGRCEIEDIMLEMQRIVRPGGVIVMRDHVDVIVAVKNIAERMNWNGRIVNSDGGAFHSEKVFVVDNSFQLL